MSGPRVEPVRPVSLRKTCSACPSQWEGELDDGRAFYVRYRWGHGCFSTGTSVEEAVGGEVVCVFAPDGAHKFDGYMTTDEMIALTGGHVDWSVLRAFDATGDAVASRGGSDD